MTNAEILQLIQDNLPDNTSQLITPAKHREVVEALLGAQPLLAEGILTSAQLLNSNTSPIELIPAPGAGLFIAMDGISVMNGTGNNYATNTSAYIRHAGQSSLSGFGVVLVNGLVQTNKSISAQLNTATIINKSVIFETNTGDPTAGDFDIWYSIPYRILEWPFS